MIEGTYADLLLVIYRVCVDECQCDLGFHLILLWAKRYLWRLLAKHVEPSSDMYR